MAPVVPQPTTPATPEPAFDENQHPKGRLSTAVIQRVVRDSFSPMVRCYEAGLARNPNLGAGKVRVRLVIKPDGQVARAEPEDHRSGPNTTLSAALGDRDDVPLLRDPQVISCVVGEFSKLVFPAPNPSGAVVVTYPVIFSVE